MAGLVWAMVFTGACGPGSSNDPCRSEEDCADGQVCADGVCVVRPDASRPPPVDGGGVDARRPPLDGGGPVCGDLECGLGQRCELRGGVPLCIDNTCDDLRCSPTERCEESLDGVGFVCFDNRCADSLECPLERYCDGTICRLDVCTPGEGACDPTGAVVVCSDDGGALETRFTCSSETAFVSACTDEASNAFCTCEDDWDCPPFMACEAGRCEGTGAPPGCRLPPLPFTDVLPSMHEGFPWGGTASDPRALRSPFPDSSQVVVTPVVANLDDDNGDGRIDERDYPEIIFLSFCSTGSNRFTNNGTLRAVHGGGARRGQDLFARCGDTLWSEGMDPAEASSTCTCANGRADLDPTAGVAVGDLDGDGIPEVVAVSESNDAPRIFSNTGVLLATAPAAAQNANPSMALANLDQEGLVEIVIGATVYTLQRTADGGLAFADVFNGSLGRGNNGQGPISCLANIAGGPEMEIIAGSTVYRLPAPPPGVTLRADCPTGDASAFCRGQLEVVWDGPTVNGTASRREGFCAIADVLGADPTAVPGPLDPLDGSPEVIVIANGRLQIYEGATGRMVRDVDLNAGTNGGAPNVDDFDGDGFPEIGTAFGTQYMVIDLQPPSASCPAWPTVFRDGTAGLQGNPPRSVPSTPCTTAADCGDPTQFACNATLGQCVCLHSAWIRRTEDDSSRVTGSTVFDFNGDGAAEIVYNDECYFRIYDGQTGAVLFREPSESRTRTENPVVADVDNDGNADIVFSTSTESGFCSDRSLAPRFNAGIEVWGDVSDSWVPARRIWNEHAYHVTNVVESGAVPRQEPDSWRPWSGRLYNSYRSQPRSLGAAPNLVVERVQVTSPDAACGTLSSRVLITARIANLGDVRVGSAIEVGFVGLWDGAGLEEPLLDAGGAPLVATLGRTLEPGRAVLVTADWDARWSTPGVLPDRLRVTVDPSNRERECIETDNERTAPVADGALVADLTVRLGAPTGVCPATLFPTTVRNVGSAPASDVRVRWYAGDPAAGGEAIFEQRIAGPIAPGGMVELRPMLPLPDRPIRVYVVVDPDDEIRECNDGNNTDRTADVVVCLG